MVFKLIEFSVENYKIFKEKVTFSMATRKNGDHTFEVGGENLMKTAMIYGPNASGKTTLLEAIDACDEYIRKSVSQSIEEGLPYIPFKFSSDKGSLSSFEIIFFLNEDVYSYIFSFNADEVAYEKLCNETDNKVLFLREGRKITDHNQKLFVMANDVESSTPKNALILTRAAQTDTKIAYEIVNAFQKNLHVIYNGLGSVTIDLIQNDKVSKDEIINHLKKADFCINDIIIEEKELDDELRKRLSVNKKNAKRFSIKMTHPIYDQTGSYVSDMQIDMKDESKGTEYFFRLIGPVVVTLQKGDVLLVDEFDNSLHPKLTKYILDLFENKETNPHNAQLIVTTHDLSLLNYKDDFIKEHFWFTEKNKYGEAKLYSLAEFKTDGLRNDQKYQNYYLEGRFGAIPFIG